MLSVSNRVVVVAEEEGEEEEETWGTWWAVQVSFLQHSQSEREE